MPTGAISSHGTLLKMADRATHITYATVAEVLDIKGPNLKGILEDATSHSSGGWKEQISVLKEAGKVTFDVNFIGADATQNKTTGLVAASMAQTKEYFQVIFPDNTGFQFYAYVDMNFEAKVKGKLTASIDLNLTGVVTAI